MKLVSCLVNFALFGLVERLACLSGSIAAAVYYIDQRTPAAANYTTVNVFFIDVTFPIIRISRRDKLRTRSPISVAGGGSRR